jgi:uncharacterized protein YrzB (UPF0473 family)
MKFGIITPVFDGCFESIKLLAKDIEFQTHTDWVWMLCSNGFSDKYSAFVDEKNNVLKNPIYRLTKLKHKLFGGSRSKLIYNFIEFEQEDGFVSIFENVCKRRNFCVNEIQCDYILMIDADAKIIKKNMLEVINYELQNSSQNNLCIYKIVHSDEGELPKFPIGFARIDLLNYCIKASLAKEIGYPTKIRLDAIGNDYWFLDNALKASNGDYLFIDEIFAQHNGNNKYHTLGKMQKGL